LSFPNAGASAIRHFEKGLQLKRAPRTIDRTPKVTAKINDQISARNVRLVGIDGEQLGIRPADEARDYAYARELDLVEVAAAADPPVCRVMDYGKWRYEEERKARASRRNQVHVSFKEVRLRPKIGDHDYEWKRNRTIEFLSHRSKVKLVVLFRGREREHPERGRALLERLVDDVKEVGHAEGTAILEGRSMTLVIAPNGPHS
jgi:translation initiation factor IF-3